MGYTISFALIGVCALSTAMLLAFVRETVSSETFSAVKETEVRREGEGVTREA